MAYEPKPNKSIRELDFKLFIGKEVEVKFGNFNKGKDVLDPDNQQISVDIEYGDKDRLYLWEYISRNGIIDKKKEGKSEIWKVKDAYLLIAKNGGRMNRDDRPRTYWEFWNDKQKERYHKQIQGGTMGRILMAGQGDMDMCCVRIEFENDMAIEDSCWEITVPEEWYSELYKDDNKFKYVDGYYKDAYKAVESFSQKSNDDMFGERYFPVLVFGKEVEHKAIEGIIWRPKSTSTPIMMDDGTVIIGTRCKPHEYQEVIEETYKAGGKVPIGAQYDW